MNGYDAASIQTATAWQRHSSLCLRWLRLGETSLKPEQKMNFSREIARASGERDKALRELHLDRDTRDNVLDALYSRALPAPADGKEDHESA